MRILGAGLSNYSVLVRADREFVVRIDGINPASHGLNRQLEWRALTEAYRAGIAPCPRYFNPELGSLVCDYLPPDSDQHSSMGQVATLLRDIHGLPARRHRLNIAEHISRYENRLQNPGGALQRQLLGHGESIARLVQAARAEQGAMVLCHNDLLRANRLRSGGRLYALDWEYCAMGSAWYDIAVVCEGDELPDADRDALVEAYLGRAPLMAEQAALARYACIYLYLELLWHMTLERESLDAQTLQHRLQRLQHKLLTIAAR